MEEIKVKVKTKDVLSISYLNRLQGDLKILSDDNYKKLKNEILTEGFCFAIHVWENKEDAKIYICDGHQRLETLTRMKEEGYSIPQIPVVFIEADNINDAKKILLGGASQYGEFNQKGAEEFISTIEGIDLEYLNQNLALNNIDYENIEFKQTEEKVIDVQGHQRKLSTYVEGEDDIPEVLKSKVNIGDIFQLGNHRLVCGDSTDIEVLDLLMDGKLADMIFTDPPYGMSYGGGRSEGDNYIDKKNGGVKIKRHGMIMNDDLEGDDLILMIKNSINSALHFSSQTSSKYICFTWRTFSEFQSALKDLELKIKNCIVWNKGSIGLGNSNYRPQHEFIFYCQGDWFGDKSQSDLWTLSRGNTGSYVHPTQKPVELIEIALNNSSKEGQAVIDVFGGSGSTLIACEKTNRKCYMVELDPKYCSVIIERWQKFTSQQAMRINQDSSTILYDDIKQTILRPAEL